MQSRFGVSECAKVLPYVPGEQPQDKAYIKLNTNESPYPPSPKAIAAVTEQQIRDLRLYSDPESKILREAIAQACGVGIGQVVVGNGSDEVLACLFRAFCGAERPLFFPDVTYGFYKVLADLFRIPYRQIAVKDDFGIDVKDYAGCKGTVVLANPNAQTGRGLALSDIEALVAQDRDRIVIVDEAYVDFGGQSALPLVAQYDNLVVVRTFSKSRSLAGARVGFCIAQPLVAADVMAIKDSINPYNINRLSMLAAAASIADTDYFEQTRNAVIRTREQTAQALLALGFDVIPSQANFLLVRPPRITAKAFYLALKDRGVLVRYFSDPRIADRVRVSIGSEQEMQVFLNQTKALLEEEGQ